MSKVDLTLDLISETDVAFLVSDGDVEVWLPRSLVSQSEDDESIFSIPEWLAVDRGLV